MTCYLVTEPSSEATQRPAGLFVETGWWREENIIFLQFYFCRADQVRGSVSSAPVANVALYAGAALQADPCELINSTMFRNTEEEFSTRKNIPLTNPLSSCCLFHKGHPFSQSAVSLSGLACHLPCVSVSPDHCLQVMSSLITADVMMSSSRVTAPLTEAPAHKSPCSHSAPRWYLRPPCLTGPW